MLTKTTPKQDAADFVEQLAALNPTLGQYAQECIDHGADPRQIATALENAAKRSRGWCIGRFG